MSHIDFSVDTSGADRRLRRLADGPDMEALLEFEKVLINQYEASQQQVHRVTHSLARSGRTDSDVGEHGWSGTLTYGGPSAGSFHDPVRYAQAEQSREGDKGGTVHDFMEPVAPIGALGYPDAIEAFFRRTN